MHGFIVVWINFNKAVQKSLVHFANVHRLRRTDSPKSKEYYKANTIQFHFDTNLSVTIINKFVLKTVILEARSADRIHNVLYKQM